MANSTIELSKKQVVNALLQFSPKELKNIMDTLFKQKLFMPSSLREITKEASSRMKMGNIKSEIVEEAIKWARC
jgi:hypothetical protein